MHYRYRSGASRDAAAERRADDARAAGIPDRLAAASLAPVLIDLRGAGGPHWRAEPAPGTCRWRVYDADTGERIMVAQIGGVIAAAHRAVPRMLSLRSAA